MKKMKKLMFIALFALVAVVCTGCVKDTKDGYTYNYASSVFPTNWNPHTYETANDADILGYTESGFYAFDYNETKDGYQIVPAMAEAEPVDVSADYVGEEWGIEAGETGRAYKINLRDNLEWENGDPITANSFIESAKRLLAPEANNYRADSLYNGNLVIAGAKSYYYQGEHAYDTAIVSAAYGADEYVPMDQFTKDAKGNLIAPNGSDVAVKLNNGGNWGSELSLYGSYGYFVTDKETKTQLEAWVKLQDAAVDSVVVLNETNIKYLQDCLAWLHGFENVEAYAAALEEAGKDPAYAYQEWQEMCFYGADYPEFSWDKVGLKVVGDDLVIILEKSLKGFYLLYNLTGSWLVHEETYDACISYVTGVDGEKLYNNDYGTTVKKFKSYGPYKLTYFELDKEYRFEKNENWYGYDLPENEGLYQTTDIVCKYISEPSTRLQEFEAGNLDSYGLQASDMEKYIQSSELYYTEGASTFFIALNPSLAGLEETQAAAGENINKTIMTVLEFRQALSFAVDRVQFCLACDPTGKPSKSVFNTLIISDPENGTAYRTNEEAKDVILNFWGLADQVGEGKRYATKDEAIDSITGVDLAQAKIKFEEAYQAAISQGLMDADDKIEFVIGVPSQAQFYVNGYDFLVNCWTKAVEGTSLEGKLTFTKDDTIGNGFADALKNNQVDILFGVGWTGAALDPYSLVSAYTDPSYQYDPSIDYNTVYAEVTFDSITDTAGKVYEDVTLVASIDAWSNKALAGVPVQATIKGTEESIEINAGTSAPLDMRTKILCAIEGKILEQYTMLPLDDESSAALKGKQVEYYTEEYVYGVGRGGIKYMTYNYTDKEWKAYVKSLGGKVDYTSAEE